MGKASHPMARRVKYPANSDLGKRLGGWADKTISPIIITYDLKRTITALKIILPQSLVFLFLLGLEWMIPLARSYGFGIYITRYKM